MCVVFTAQKIANALNALTSTEVHQLVALHVTDPFLSCVTHLCCDVTVVGRVGGLDGVH